MSDMATDRKQTLEDTEKCAMFMESRMREQIEIFKAKNPPYGNSAIRGIKRYGVQSGVWRLFDKFNRIESLLYGTENTVDDEKVEDTLIDMAVYAMMIAYTIKENKTPAPVADDVPESRMTYATKEDRFF